MSGEFIGLSINEYLIMRLDSEMYVYNTIENEFQKFNGLKKHLGSCYIKLNSTHFIQTGGYHTWRGIKYVHSDVFMVAAETTPSTMPPIRVTNTQMTDLILRRRYHGCGAIRTHSGLTLLIAGGSATEGQIMKSVEYLDLKTNDLGEIPEEQLRNSEWQTFPSLKIPRVGYPSVVNLGNETLVVGGDCGRAHKEECILIERYNYLTGSWHTVKSTGLHHSRHMHNTFHIPTNYC